jgi:valyl-tRNA synthetase
MISEQQHILVSLAKIDSERIEIKAVDDSSMSTDISLVVSTTQIYLDTNENIDTEAETARIENEIDALENQIERLEKLLDSPFADKAPNDVVEKERQRLTEHRASRDTLAKHLQELQQ